MNFFTPTGWDTGVVLCFTPTGWGADVFTVCVTDFFVGNPDDFGVTGADGVVATGSGELVLTTGFAGTGETDESFTAATLGFFVGGFDGVLDKSGFELDFCGVFEVDFEDVVLSGLYNVTNETLVEEDEPFTGVSSTNSPSGSGTIHSSLSFRGGSTSIIGSLPGAQTTEGTASADSPKAAAENLR
jgi:hypothetical protein